jgi:hypothetical protein
MVNVTKHEGGRFARPFVAYLSCERRTVCSHFHFLKNADLLKTSQFNGLAWHLFVRQCEIRLNFFRNRSFCFLTGFNTS